MFFQRILDKITGVNNYEYGLRLVTGTFGSGKTKNTFMEAFLRKQENPHGIIISNIPYKDEEGSDLVDISFDSKSDLQKILKYVFLYLRDTNNHDYLSEGVFVPIKIIVDEAHLYYFSRDFKSFDMEMMTILTQCRKRLISIYFITQELPQIDKFLRRLCPEVIVYSRSFAGLYKKSLMYFKSTEKSDVNDEYNVQEIESKTIFWDKLRLMFNKSLIKFFEQKYLTYYICGANDTFNYDYNVFYNYIEKKRQLILDDLYGPDDKITAEQNLDKVLQDNNLLELSNSDKTE